MATRPTRQIRSGLTRAATTSASRTLSSAPCGDWSKDLSESASNLPGPDFGCATQQNIAAMVADPRDLLGPRDQGPADATRRTTVIGKYEKGEATGAAKSPEQSVTVSQMSN